MKFSLPFRLAGLTVLILFADSVSAISADVLPGSTKPETVSRSLVQHPRQTQTTLPPLQTPDENEASPLGEEAKKIKFKLNGIVLEGNHVYKTSDLFPLYKNKIGQTISVAELFTVVQDITNYYRNNGFIITRAILPPQHVKDGIVKVQIIEGFLDKVDVSGNPKGAACLVKIFGDQISACRPLEISRMEKYLMMANEIPATQVRAVLAPSKKTTGAADLTLVTDNHPVTGYFSYDNYGTRYIGPQQMTGNVAFNSFITSGDSTQFTMTKTPKGGELTFMDLNYNMGVDKEGTRWLLGSTRAHTHPLFVLRPVQVDGLNNNYYTSLQFPIIRKRDKILTLTTAFNWMDSNVTNAPDSTKLYTDHIRSLDFGGVYNFSDKWYGSNFFGANIRKGLPFMGYTQDTNQATAETSRPGGEADYTKVTAQVSRLQAIKGPVSLYGIIRGQWAFDPLLASEQFSWGGNPLGRGYDIAELIGDKGLGESLELRYDWGISKFYINALQLYIFYDAGQIWNRISNASTPEKLTATSTGFGVRFWMTKYVSGNFMWAQPLTKEVAAEELIHEGWRPRVFFSVVASFG